MMYNEMIATEMKKKIKNCKFWKILPVEVFCKIIYIIINIQGHITRECPRDQSSVHLWSLHYYKSFTRSDMHRYI